MDQNVGFDMGKLDYIENSKLNIADKWLISLDHVTVFDTKLTAVWQNRKREWQMMMQITRDRM